MKHATTARQLVSEVVEREEWLESMGLDPNGDDGRRLSAAVRWFDANCSVLGIVEPITDGLRKLFVRYAAPLMVAVGRETHKTADETTDETTA